MTDTREIEKLYRENLEASIIRHLAFIRSIDLQTAMATYYRSRLAVEIENGAYGIDNMDPKYLAEDLILNEPELFETSKT